MLGSHWRTLGLYSRLKRCSKSCRLRWTNYLRPGIKRGNFNDEEEKLIIHLQALLGNRWAAIASYLPERTDNDIKNYWNTHLRKKLQMQERSSDISSTTTSSNHPSVSRGQWERRLQTDIKMAMNVQNSSSEPLVYASSAENISRLLEGWTRGPGKVPAGPCGGLQAKKKKKKSESTQNSVVESGSGEGNHNVGDDVVVSLEMLDSMIDGLNSEVSVSVSETESKPNSQAEMAITTLETWLLDDNLGVGGSEEVFDMSLRRIQHISGLL